MKKYLRYYLTHQSPTNISVTFVRLHVNTELVIVGSVTCVLKDMTTIVFGLVTAWEDTITDSSISF